MIRFLFLITSSLFTVQSFAQTEETEYTFTQKHITPTLERSIDQHSVFTWVFGAYTVALARNDDDRVREEYRGYQKMSKDLTKTGDAMGTGAAAVLVAGTQYFLDDRKYVYESQLRGLVYAGLTTYVLKETFHRQRPGFSENHQSFPSGHTSTTFMTATQLTYAYGWKAAVIAYPLALFTGASRLSADVHWFSDVIGGAFIGYWSARATYYDENEYYQKKSTQTHYEILPLLGSESPGITFLMSY